MLKTQSGRWLTLLLIAALAGIVSGCNLASTPGQNTVAISGPPTVQIAAPPANATYLENVAVNIQALIGNAGTDIDRIEILVDGTIIQTLKAPNPGGAPSFSIAQSWQAAGEGQHNISITAFRADGSSSAPASVAINVITTQPSPTTGTTQTTGGATVQPTTATTGGNTNPPPQPTTATSGGAAATSQSAPTNTSAPAVSPTPSTPYTTTIQGINVRSGPSTKFNPPIGSLAADQSVDLLARSPDGQWFKVKYYNGAGWVFAAYTKPSVDPASLTVDAGPPIPADTATPLPTALPIPPTAVPPQTTANLVLGNVNINPGLPIVCGKTVGISIDVANLGGQPTTTSGSISIRDFRLSDNTEDASTTGAFGPIQNGQTINVSGMFLTVTTFVGEQHKLVITVNPGGGVPETSSSDNSRELTYNLGGC